MVSLRQQIKPLKLLVPKSYLYTRHDYKHMIHEFILRISALVYDVPELRPSTKCYYMLEDKKTFNAVDLDRIIEMAWEDRTPFDAIKAQFGASEQQVIALMRQEMKPSSFRMWRKRVQGRATKHLKLLDIQDHRFKSSLQKPISNNKISKRV